MDLKNEQPCSWKPSDRSDPRKLEDQCLTKLYDYADIIVRELVATSNGIYPELEIWRLARETLERAEDALEPHGRAGVLPIPFCVDLILAIVRFKDQQTEQRNKGGDVVELRRP